MARLNLRVGRGGGGASATRLLVILVLACVVIMTVYTREGAVGPFHLLRSAVQTLAVPFQVVGSQICRPINAIGTAARDAGADSQTLSQLKAENDRLTQQVAELNEYKAENDRLEALIGLSNAYSLSGVAARVIGVSDDYWSDTITIDKGSSSGIKVDMPVTVGSGVIGQVCAVSAASSTVRLLTDPEMGVSAMLQDSREVGVLTGSVDGTLRLSFITSDVSVVPGEIVVTSGLGGVYPKGLPLGVVVSASSSVSGQYQEITVRSTAVAGNLEEVLVVTTFDPTADGSSNAQDIIASADGSGQGGDGA